jgi:peptide/nickel transport system substrate-binding protein
MKKLRWPLLIVFLALVAIGILLFSQQPAINKTQPTIPTEVVPIKGGIYTEALVGSLSRLNPLLDMSSPVDRDVDRLLYSGLIRFDGRGLPLGDLADSWGISSDGLIYNFSIRANAVWHDGQPVTSDDVIFTIELLRNANPTIPTDLQDFWQQIEIKRLDDKTVQFRLPEPFAPFMDYLTFGVLPEHLLGDLTFDDLVNAQFNIQPIGSGPYRFDHLIMEGDKINGLVLTAFDKYYATKPYIEQIAFRYYPNVQAALEAYQKGEVMGIGQVTTDILPGILKDSKLNLNLYTGRLPELTLIFLNMDSPQAPFLKEADIRRALLMGLNRQLIVDQLLSGQAIIADGPIFPGTWAYYEGMEHIGYDPDAAIALLKKAGYTLPAEGGDIRTKEGTPLEFELLYPDDEVHANLAEAIQQDWARLGVSTILKAVLYDELVNDYLSPREYQAALVNLNLTRFADPDPYPFWHQAQATGGQNYSKWDDRQASEYLEQARVTTNIEERTRLYRNFQVRFGKELPALPLYYPVYTYAVSADVQGVRMGPLFDPSDRFDTITGWFMVTENSAKSTSTP